MEELNLWFGWSTTCYSLPQSVLVAKSLTVLTLKGCCLKSTCSDINLPSLRKLSLKEVDADDEFIQNLIFGCPAIEYRGIFCRQCIKSIKIFGLLKLMSMEI